MVIWTKDAASRRLRISHETVAINQSADRTIDTVDDGLVVSL